MMKVNHLKKIFVVYVIVIQMILLLYLKLQNVAIIYAQIVGKKLKKNMEKHAVLFVEKSPKKKKEQQLKFELYQYNNMEVNFHLLKL